MFDALGDKLQAILGGLRSRGKLDEETISKAMREIRLALLEADVNLAVVKEFTASVKERALGQEVMKSLTPGQQVVKIVHEELAEIMGSADSRLAFTGRPPTVILLAGLQGSGKTTAAAKLALMLRKDGKSPALVAADLQRPAAISQLEQLGKQIQIPVYSSERSDPVAAAKLGLEQARSQGRDVVIVDTAGRLQIDEELMAELEQVHKAVKPTNVLLVLDSMTGQQAVDVALAFQERIAFDGVLLTKLDGDARGGAALSVRAVTGKPIKFASVGEKLDQLEVFHPDRMASRILGMGDVLTLIEKAEAVSTEDEQKEMEARMMAGEMNFDDFLASYRMMRKMGSMKSLIGMLPGVGKQLKDVDVDEREMARVEAIILSMTPRERRLPHVIDGSRRLAHRGRQRDDGSAGQPAAERPQADAEDDEAAQQGQDARAARNGRAALGTEKERYGSSHEVDAGRLQEEPDLPRRGGRLALAARRQVHRHRGAVQPAARAVADRVRRGQGQGLALEGRSALAAGRAPAQSQEHRVVSTVSAPADLVLFLAKKIVEDPEAVRVEEIDSDGDLLLRLHVAEGDRGKVIGRRGRMVQSLRTLARAAGARSDRRVLLEIAE